MAKDIKNKKTAKKKKPDATHSAFELVEDFLSKHYDIRYNEVSNHIECKRLDQDGDYETLNENNVYRFLQHHNVKFSMGNLLSLLRSDYVEKFNPFVEYFDNLPKWDGKDHITALCGFIKVKKQERFNNHFKKMLIRSIACSLDPDYFNKHLFLFLGGQHLGKTYFMRWLCPPDLKAYYTENISTDKDSIIAMCENFMINMDELAGLAKFELRALKSILSKDKVKVRIPYDKRPSLAPRRANFVGSTNEVEFLTDVTGTVRWLCFELIDINKKYSKEISITQIWAQAYALYKKGDEFNITASEIEENETVNVQHQISTMEVELIQKYLVPQKMDGNNKPIGEGEFMTSSDIVLHLSKIEGNAVRINNVGVGKALTFLGFDRYDKRSEEKRIPQKGYYILCNCFQCAKDRKERNELADALNSNPKLLV
jgi:predicted P-loop ATPase